MGQDNRRKQAAQNVKANNSNDANDELSKHALVPKVSPAYDLGAIPSLPVMRLDPLFASSIGAPSDEQWIWQLPTWPAFTYDMARLAAPMGTARQAQGRLQKAGELLNPTLTRDIRARLLLEEGISTSAIEGEQIDPDSLAASIARRLNVPWPSKADTKDTDGLTKVLADATDTRTTPLSREGLCMSHSELFSAHKARSLQRFTIGDLRPEEVYVAHIQKSHEIVDFIAIPRQHLEAELDRFINWFNESQGNLDGLLRAGITHLWFVTLHPFDDGNGRIARALTDRAIAQDWGSSECLFRMSGQILSVRNGYYHALKYAQSSETQLDITEWLQWFLEQVREACTTSEGTIKHVLAKATFWARHRTVDLNERQRKILNRLLDTKPGEFKGGMTKNKYMSMTDCSGPTATRDLTALEKCGCLIKLAREEQGPDGEELTKPMGGRSTAYDIPWADLFRGARQDE